MDQLEFPVGNSERVGYTKGGGPFPPSPHCPIGFCMTQAGDSTDLEETSSSLVKCWLIFFCDGLY